MSPTCQSHLSPGRLVLSTQAPLCCLFRLREFTNRSVVAPGGKIAGNRMWIHPRRDRRWEKPALRCKLPQHASFDVLPASFSAEQNSLKQEGFVSAPSKRCFDCISVSSRDRIEEVRYTCVLWYVISPQKKGFFNMILWLHRMHVWKRSTWEAFKQQPCVSNVSHKR